MAIAVLLAPKLYNLLVMGYPSFGSTAGDRGFFYNNLQGSVMALVLAAFLVAFITQPEKMAPAYWFVPAYFAGAGLSLVITGLLIGADRILSPGGASGLLAVGFGNLCLGLLLWLVRPVDSETESHVPDGIAGDAGIDPA
ncbi:MAG TPA: hypothetical protein VND22_10235 [Actinomycetota bacterium]|nr:hypothetical protein [Actinomycetota bacterium]